MYLCTVYVQIRIRYRSKVPYGFVIDRAGASRVLAQYSKKSLSEPALLSLGIVRGLNHYLERLRSYDSPEAERSRSHDKMNDSE